MIEILPYFLGTFFRISTELLEYHGNFGADELKGKQEE
jgi:hypothetical protein